MISNVVFDAEHAHLAPEAIDNLLRTMERRAAAMVDSIESSIVRFTRRTAYDLSPIKNTPLLAPELNELTFIQSTSTRHGPRPRQFLHGIPHAPRLSCL